VAPVFLNNNTHHYACNFLQFCYSARSTFQEFNGPYIITQGGPRGATTLASLLIYNNAFKSYEMGLANAQAWLLFSIIAVFTIIAFTSEKYWVYYSDDGR
jgi:oligogalacturonide transport system permease protein